MNSKDWNHLYIVSFIVLLYNELKAVISMNRVKVVDLMASVCLLIGSIINIVELFIDVHIIISVIATFLIFVSIILWLIVIKRMKAQKQ